MQITFEALLPPFEEINYLQNAKRKKSKTVSFKKIFTGRCSTELFHLLARVRHSSPSEHHPRLGGEKTKQNM
jgi:hypothetical protein